MVANSAAGHMGDPIREISACFSDIVSSGHWFPMTGAFITSCLLWMPRAKTPKLSRAVQTDFMPSRGMQSRDALMPKMPMYDAGRIKLPLACVTRLNNA